MGNKEKRLYKNWVWGGDLDNFSQAMYFIINNGILSSPPSHGH